MTQVRRVVNTRLRKNPINFQRNLKILVWQAQILVAQLQKLG